MFQWQNKQENKKKVPIGFTDLLLCLLLLFKIRRQRPHSLPWVSLSTFMQSCKRTKEFRHHDNNETKTFALKGDWGKECYGKNNPSQGRAHGMERA